MSLYLLFHINQHINVGFELPHSAISRRWQLAQHINIHFYHLGTGQSMAHGHINMVMVAMVLKKYNIWHSGLVLYSVTVMQLIMHNQELYILYCVQNVIRKIKSREVRWAGHVAWVQDFGGKARRDHQECLFLVSKIHGSESCC